MLLFLLSIFSGMIAAMGIGGGTILIPVLVFLMNTEQHTAQGINLISFIPIAFIAVIIHLKNKNILVKFSILLIVSGVAGALIGSKLAVHLNSVLLRKMFGVFLLALSIYQFIFHKKA